MSVDRRSFLQSSAVATAAALAWPDYRSSNQSDLAPIFAQIEKRHDEAVARLQEWIRQASIAAENRGVNEGCELTMRLLREAGFDQVTKIPTDGQPGIFATLDAGAPRTLGLYFMYDVKQADPAEWSSPPWTAALVDRPGMGKVLIGRGAVNQKGPEATFLAALHAIRGAGRKPPVNFVLVAEGEEEIGSPHFPQVVRRPEVQSALRKTFGIFMPSASQGLDGQVTMFLGAKGVIECELVSSGERWGRGPKKDIHSSNKARVDSPAWHLVEALATLVSPDGNDPAIDGYADKARPMSASEKAMVAEAARRLDEKVAKQELGVEHWVHDVSFVEALERLVSLPTVNIEGLVGGYTGPGGKTILPHRAVAKLDLRLVPDMTAAESLAALKAHLAKRGFGDIEVNMTGGYDPTSTPADASLVQAQVAVYKRSGINPVVLPRIAGSWPGYVFTGDPLRLAAGHFGLGHGSGAHAPDEYYIIESTNSAVRGMDGAVRSYVEYLYELARAS
ncbi:MAG TPA: M20/M25/M40 family metallo-hydrolase [Gemmatimonadales bacterium]|nr:M20/M25/M40 family metallo-hydrolase [Gemmatimonadales bacterium]